MQLKNSMQKVLQMVEQRGWKIDKHIPVALLLTLLIHLVGTVWAVAKFTSRVDNLDGEMVQQRIINDKHDGKIEALQNVGFSTDKRLTVIENSVIRIESSLQQDRARNKGK